METLFVGKNRIFLNHVDSTNKYLANHDRLTDLVEGTLVITDEQQEGKGQRSNKWLSEKGKNLLVSVLLRPKFLKHNDYFMLNKGVTLAVLNTVEHFVAEKVHIKWPNDTLVNKRKIAGLLVELNWRASQCQNAIVGLGLNVNQLFFEGLPNATSIQSIIGSATSVSEVIDVFCQNLEYQYLQLRTGDWDSISMTYNNCLWGRGNAVVITQDGIQLQGTLIGVTNNGLLSVRIKDEIRNFAHGDIKVVYL